jgi:hypothetical protein
METNSDWIHIPAIHVRATLCVRTAVWYAKESTYFLQEISEVEAARISRIFKNTYMLIAHREVRMVSQAW